MFIISIILVAGLLIFLCGLQIGINRKMDEAVLQSILNRHRKYFFKEYGVQLDLNKFK